VSGREFAAELKRHQPVPPRLPQVPRGRRPTPEQLQGDWTGETKLYPNPSKVPAKMKLRLTRAGNGWQAQGMITFGGKASDITLKISDFQITDEGIAFVDNNKETNGGGVARYRAAYTGHSMRGIAEINVKEARLYVIGSWELKAKR
jgi:hypothetical protein